MGSYYPDEMLGLTNLEKLIDRQDQGMIGKDFLEQFDLRIEYNKREITPNFEVKTGDFMSDNRKDLLITVVRFSSQRVVDQNHTLTLKGYDPTAFKYAFYYVDFKNNEGRVISQNLIETGTDITYGVGELDHVDRDTDNPKYLASNDYAIIIVTANEFQCLNAVNRKLMYVPSSEIDKWIYELVTFRCHGCTKWSSNN